MAKSSVKKDYKGFGRVASLVLVIIFLTAWIMGIITRFREGKIVAGIIRIFFGFNILWIVDLIVMIVKGRICRLINF